MSFNKTKETIKEHSKEVATSIKDETVDVAKINIGKVVYQNARNMLSDYLPKFSLIERITISKEKRELAELMGVYGLLHILKTRYTHYLIDAVTAYLNLELQTKLIGSINVKDLDKIFTLPTSK